MNERPAPKDVADARELAEAELAQNDEKRSPTWENALRVLIAATTPPTDKEIVARYNELLKTRGWKDSGNAIWFADGVRAFLGKAERASTCACGQCHANAHSATLPAKQ